MRKLKMKLLASGAMALMTGCFFGKSKTVDAQTAKGTNPNESIYNIKIMQLDEKTSLDLSQYKGKKILFVNTASECGFTPQYEDLQKLQNKYPEKLVVIGSPCNQFGGQEPGGSEQIASFCKKNFGVTFMMTQKIEVKGENQHPLYEWLTRKTKNGVLESEVKWNFNKFLVDENGNLMAYFASTTGPMSSNITELIDK